MVQLDLMNEDDWDTDLDCCTEENDTVFKGGTLGDCNDHCPQIGDNDDSGLELEVEILNSNGTDVYVDIKVDGSNDVDISPSDYTRESIDRTDSKKFTFTISDDGGQDGGQTTICIKGKYATSTAGYDKGVMSTVDVRNKPEVTH